MRLISLRLYLEVTWLPRVKDGGTRTCLGAEEGTGVSLWVWKLEIESGLALVFGKFWREPGTVLSNYDPWAQ